LPLVDQAVVPSSRHCQAQWPSKFARQVSVPLSVAELATTADGRCVCDVQPATTKTPIAAIAPISRYAPLPLLVSTGRTLLGYITTLRCLAAHRRNSST
jgi:hypothetical protein